ncbi:MAG: S8 family peptidase [Deltaproteobacteria bacterium]|nr:S8 family peptidase [Deltaproteobacteria bacterium]
MGAIPEEVLVLESVGPVENFLVAARNIPGMEFLGEIEEEDIPPDDDFFALDSKGRPKPEKALRGRIFLVFSNQQALNQMLSLWRNWGEGLQLPQGLRKWNELFAHLRDVRPWGVKDRLLETGIIEDWKERVDHEKEILPCEIELWFRSNLHVRAAARERVTNLVEALRGHISQEAIIEKINYHALLAELPATGVAEIIDGSGYDVSLVQCEQIQFFRATGQMAGIIPDDEVVIDGTEVIEPRDDIGEPVVALLDGFPLQGHQRLNGRLIVDDPDDVESQYQAQERRHGTAMASLILHGDLDSHEQPLNRPLYVRPILQPDARDWRQPREETVAENILVVDLIHRAVRRIFERDGNDPATAPTVCIINLSVGIKDRLFHGALSPFARLLDWLTWEYQVLFIVSSGNHAQQIHLDVTGSDFSSLSRETVQELFLKAIAADVRNRRLLSPAEGVNVVTTGALQFDSSDHPNLPRAILPYVDEGLPSPINAQGLGFRRAIKPEILAPGGKIVFLESPVANSGANFEVYGGALAPGQKVATPGPPPGDLRSVCYTRGTSNAAAITSRAAGILYDVLEQLKSEPGGEIIDTVPASVWLKALLTHASEWGEAWNILERILRTTANSRQFKEYIARLLGYGGIDVARVQECTQNLATALSGGIIEKDHAHIHRFPLPPSLSGKRGWRRLTITLAWHTPVNPAHQNWRRAALWFEPPKELLRVERKQANWQAVKRGTLQHEILEGNRATAFVDGDNLEIQVNCTSDAGALEDAVPYALVATLEVAPAMGIAIYDEIRVRIHAARIRVAPSE